MISTRWCFALLLALAVPAMPHVVRAQGARDSAGAETLFLEGRKLIEAREYAQACKKLEASQRLAPAVGTLLDLGDGYQQNGQIAPAWLTFREATAEAQRLGRHDRERLARERASQLE